ncbi:hypothetical protein PHLH5_36960 [Pseudomonas sp. Cab53]|nr:hypothetical protein PHLH5_36960 [Pseudomonas sp. Cab53]
MRTAMGALLLLGTSCLAEEVPLRIAITDGWAMPMVQIERGRPTQGILPDIMISLATQVGMPAEFHVLSRARLDGAMKNGETDLRCYVTPEWVHDDSRNYLWSIPLFFQRDLLVGPRAAPSAWYRRDWNRNPSAPCSVIPTQPCNRCSTAASYGGTTPVARTRCWRNCWPGGIAMR